MIDPYGRFSIKSYSYSVYVFENSFTNSFITELIILRVNSALRFELARLTNRYSMIAVLGDISTRGAGGLLMQLQERPLSRM